MACFHFRVADGKAQDFEDSSTTSLFLMMDSMVKPEFSRGCLVPAVMVEGHVRQASFVPALDDSEKQLEAAVWLYVAWLMSRNNYSMAGLQISGDTINHYDGASFDYLSIRVKGRYSFMEALMPGEGHGVNSTCRLLHDGFCNHSVMLIFYQLNNNVGSPLGNACIVVGQGFKFAGIHGS